MGILHLVYYECRLLLTEKKWKRLSTITALMVDSIDDVEMFSSFHDLGIETYRIDTKKPLNEQKHVDAVFHKLMY